MKILYKAYDRGGKAVAGAIEAGSADEARELLRKQGYFAAQVEDTGSAPAPSTPGKKKGSGKRLKQLAMFSRQLQVLLSSGTPIVQAIQSIEKQIIQEDWKAIVAKLREKVEQGSPMSEAMKSRPEVFDDVCISLVAAGETSGNMGQMLDRLAALLRKQLYLRNAIIGAMVYPCLLMVLGLVVMLSMLMFVLPRFSTLFEQLDTPLPPTTKILMWVSEMLWSYWWLIFPSAIGGVFAAKAWLRSSNGVRFIHSALLKTPRVDRFTRNLLSAKVARMLGVLLESKVALLDALQLTKQGASNYRYAELIEKAEEAVGRGEPVSAILATSDLISPCVQEAFRTGEQSGQLGTPLVQMADFLDEENDNIIKTLTRVIEPLILVVLGVVVGTIAMSMFLPLFDLVSAAQGGH